jgi:hypothetical protein
MKKAGITFFPGISYALASSLMSGASNGYKWLQDSIHNKCPHVTAIALLLK